MSSFFRSELVGLTAYTPQFDHNGNSAKVIDRLDTNESPFNLPTDFKGELANEYRLHIDANRYPDGSHILLKEAIANYVAESSSLPSGMVTPSHISVGNGSDELIRSILIATCLNGNGSVLVAQPTFSMYAIVAQTLGISVVTIGRDPNTFAIDIDAAQQAIDQTTVPPVRVIFVVHPNSPTANALQSKELQWLRQIPDNILVVIDEAYFEFSQSSVVHELDQHPNWVVTRTFSKAFRLAAHRVGYSVSHPDVTAIFEKIRLPYNLPTFSQLAAITALKHRKEILQGVKVVLTERDRISDELQSLDSLHIFPSHANFIYAQLTTADSPDQLTYPKIIQSLREQGTLIRHTGGGLRITVGETNENIRTVKRLYSLF